MKEQIEKQAIEEMALELCRPWNIVKTMHHRTCGNCDTSSCDIYELCVDLYNAGYRKQSVGEWKVDGNDYNRRAQCSNCEKEYAVQRGMLQLHRFPYCPNCGAKMKGGAE